MTLVSKAHEVRSSPSFEEYVQARGAALVRFAILLTGDDHRAQDIVQDALAKAYLRWGRIRRTDNPDVYLRQLIANGTRSWWRRRSNRELPMDQTSGQTFDQASDRAADRPAPGDLGGEAAERDALWRLIVTLPHKQRAVVVLRYYEDLDDTTIGEILDCSAGTVRTHAMRALNKLRAHFEGDGHDRHRVEGGREPRRPCRSRGRA